MHARRVQKNDGLARPPGVHQPGSSPRAAAACRTCMRLLCSAWLHAVVNLQQKNARWRPEGGAVRLGGSRGSSRRLARPAHGRRLLARTLGTCSKKARFQAPARCKRGVPDTSGCRALHDLPARRAAARRPPQAQRPPQRQRPQRSPPPAPPLAAVWTWRGGGGGQQGDESRRISLVLDDLRTQQGSMAC